MWKVIFLQNKAFWWLSLVSDMSCELIAKPDCQFLSYSAPAVMTLHLHACFTHVAFWRVASHESLVRNLQMHTLLNFFTLSHTQPLHNFHLNTWYLIAKITSKFGMD